MLPWLNPVLFDDFRNKQLSDYLWLLRDEFWTAAGAPLGSPHTCEPGPGQLALIQTDGQFSIANERLVMPQQATPVWGDLGAIGRTTAGAGFERRLGRTLFKSITRTGGLGNEEFMFAWSASGVSAALAQIIHGLWHVGATEYWYGSGAAQQIPGGIVDSTEYKFAFSLRASGAYMFIKGGAFTNWTLLWVFNTDVTSPLYSLLIGLNADVTSDFQRVIDLPPASVPSRAVVMSDSFKSTVIRDYGDYALDGQPVNVKLDGTKGAYNGVSSYTNIYSVELNRVFDGQEGTLIIRPKVSAVGVWTDGVARYPVRLRVNANNALSLFKSTANNRFTWIYTANGVSQSVNKNALSDTNPMTIGITYSKINDVVRPFYNGVQEGADLGGLDTWSGNLVSTDCNIGVSAPGSSSGWPGDIYDCIISVKAPGATHAIVATPAQMSTIHTALAAGTLTKADLEAIFNPGGFIWYKHTDQYISDGKGHVEGDIVRANDSGGNALHGLHNHVGLPGGYGNYELKRLAYTNLYSTALNTKFNGQLGFAFIRARARNEGVWVDGSNRYALNIQVDANNFIQMMKNPTGGFIIGYEAGGSFYGQTPNLVGSGNAWKTFAATFDRANTKGRVFLDGVQNGPDKNVVTNWAGALSPVLTVAGAGTTTPSLHWDGDISDVIVGLGATASIAQIAALHAHVTAGTLSGPILDQMFGANNWAWYEFNETALLDGSAITHVGPTWSRDANWHANNEPTPGAETLTDPGLEAWNSATDLTNYVETIAGASTVNREAAIVHGGTFACRMDIDAVPSFAQIAQAPAGYVAGEWTVVSVWAKSNPINKSFAFLHGFGFDSVFFLALTATYTQYKTTGRVIAGVPAFGVKYASGSDSSSLYFDDLSTKKLVFSELISVRDYNTPYVIIDCYPRITGFYQSGGVACYRASDDSCLHFYYNPTIGHAYLEQKAAGVWTQLIDQAAVYSAGAPLRLIVQPSGANLAVALYYNNVLMGTIQTVNAASIISNTMHGPFSTDVNAALDNFVVMPTGAVDGRFNPALDPYTRPA